MKEIVRHLKEMSYPDHLDTALGKVEEHLDSGRLMRAGTALEGIAESGDPEGEHKHFFAACGLFAAALMITTAGDPSLEGARAAQVAKASITIIEE